MSGTSGTVDSSITVDSPRNCVMEQKSECEPGIAPAINHNLDSRPMEGITYLERPAPAVYLDSWPMEGEVRDKILEWEPSITPAINHNLDSRPMEGITYLERPAPALYLDSWPMEGEVRKKRLEWEPVIIPADRYTLDSRPIEGMTYLEHPAPAVYLDSWPMKGASCPRPHVDLVRGPPGSHVHPPGWYQNDCMNLLFQNRDVPIKITWTENTTYRWNLYVNQNF